MKVLAHNPPSRRKREHLAVQEGDKWVSLCGIYPYEGAETSKGIWIVRDERPDDVICGTCCLRKRRLENPPAPRPPLPCTKPDALVTLWVRDDDDQVLVHTTTPAGGESRCGITNPWNALDRWKKVLAQPASVVTCSLCLKAEGLYKGHPPHKQNKSKPARATRRQGELDKWYRLTGKYHSSDPRR